MGCSSRPHSPFQDDQTIPLRLFTNNFTRHLELSADCAKLANSLYKPRKLTSAEQLSACVSKDEVDTLGIVLGKHLLGFTNVLISWTFYTAVFIVIHGRWFTKLTLLVFSFPRKEVTSAKQIQLSIALLR